MNRRPRQTFTPEQKREYAKLMVEENYSNKEIQDISGACSSAVVRWKKQYQDELAGITPNDSKALTPEHQKIQALERQLWRAKRDNEILKKAAAFFVRDNHLLK
jgi:transposase